MSTTKPSRESATFARFLTTQKVAALYMQAPVSNGTVFVISTLFFFMLHERLDAGLLGMWVGLMWVTAAYRLSLWVRHRQAGAERPQRYWLQHYTAGSVAVGVSWSLIYLFLHDLGDIVVVVALFMLLFGVLSSTVAILSVHLPAFMGYTVPQVLVMAGTLLDQGDSSLTLLAAALLLYLGMLSLFARNAYRQFESTLRLANENESLAGQLAEENSRREAVIRERTAELQHTNSELAREVGEREDAEQRARLQFGLLRSVLDATPDLIFYKDYRDRDGIYLGCNEAFAELVGKVESAIIGQSDLDLFDTETAAFFRRKDRDMLDADETRINEEWVTYPEGRQKLLSTLRTPFFDEDERAVGVLGVSRDITEQKRTEEALRRQQHSLRHMAHHDALTDLPNRLLLTDRLSHSIANARRNEAGLALLFIDLDHFKQINDSLGHSAGDELLVAVAERLLASVREADTVARLGGDEFIILADQLTDAPGAAPVAEKILAAFEQPFVIHGTSLSVSTSIGISLYPEDGGDAETLLRNADAAMYCAKTDGRGVFRFYSADMTEQARHRVSMEGALRDALKGDQFVLYYQPRVDMRTGAILGAEALLRWEHPERGLLMPSTFITIAEESGLIIPIGLWVLNEACRQLRRWQDAGVGDFQMAVNVSGREMHGNPLVHNVEEALDHSGCDAGALELEITEGYLVQEPEKARHVLQALRDRGVQISIDDFGTGYSSLSYLKQYPIGTLKVDQSFVRDIASSTDDQGIVRAIIGLGRSLGLAVIGEGVETQGQADFLQREGCHLAQGFLYGKAVPAAELEARLLTGVKPGEAVHPGR